MDADDANHGAAAAHLRSVMDAESLVTHNYVVVETVALIQHRLGMEAVAALLDALIPVLEIRWIGEVTHRAAVSALLSARRRHISLVDWVSFQLMREEGIISAFAFDEDFSAQGFTSVP